MEEPRDDEQTRAANELPIIEEQVTESPEDKSMLPEEQILLGSDGSRYKIGDLISGGEISRYHGEALGTDDVSTPVIIMQASTESAASALQRMHDMLEAAKSPMLPVEKALISGDKSTYLVVDDPGAPTLAEAMSSGMQIARLINVLAQVAVGISNMHKAGWLHLGLRPEEIYLSKPVCIMGMEYVCRIGEKPDEPFYIPGYSAPELIAGGPIDNKADIYSIGALLYRAVTGAPIAETGADLITWKPPKPVPGVPQILSSCLSEHDSRYPTVEALHAALRALSRRMQPQTSCSIGAYSTIGLEPTRTTNQDAYAYVTSGIGEDQGERFRAMVCVIDGMGGMAAGEIASKTAAEAMTSSAMADLNGPNTLSAVQQVDTVKNWVQEANQRVVDVMTKMGAKGGCTMAAALLIERRLAIAHVGDCRIYHIRQGEITQLTRDHSLAVALAMQGQIEMHEVRNHPDRNMVTRSLGDRYPLPDHFIDTLDITTGKPIMELREDDVLLLCSDGLWEPVLENEMLDCLSKHSPDLHQAAVAMVSIALDRGAPDNATAVLLRLNETHTWEEEVTVNGQHNTQPA